MGERVNITDETIGKAIENFPWEPMGNRVVVTTNTEEVDGKLVLSENMLAEEQYVIAVGPMAAKFLQPGMKVMLDIELMTERKPLDYDQTQVSSQIKIDPIEVEDNIYATIDDRKIKFKAKQ